MNHTSSRQQLSPTHYPSHVLFQFILVQFLRTQDAFGKLTAASRQIGLCLANENTEQTHIRQALLCATECLAGAASPFRSNFSWNPSHGILSSLKNDSTLFESAFSEEIPEAACIKKQVAKCWLYCTELRDLATHLRHNSFLNNSAFFPCFQKIEKQMQTALKKLSLAICKAMLHFGSNENVLFCLIRQQKQFDAVFGRTFTKKFIKKVHLNLDSAHQFLVEAYRKRGFEGLIPEITQKIKSL